MAVGFENLVYYMEAYGVVDFLLPFLLAFVVVYAITGVLPLFKDNNSFRQVLSLVLALMFVIPHITGTYPLGYDPVEVLITSIPSIVLVLLGLLMVLVLTGLAGGKISDSGIKFFSFVSFGFIVYIFGSALNLWRSPDNIFYWWTPELTEFLLVLAVFGGIVWFITSDPDKPKPDSGESFFKQLGDLFDKRQ